MTDAPRKPFWKRKRWIAAAVLWLVMTYPLSVGLVVYADGRGWVRRALAETYCLPLVPIARSLPGDPVRSCLNWCCQLGQRHRYKSL